MVDPGEKREARAITGRRRWFCSVRDRERSGKDADDG